MPKVQNKNTKWVQAQWGSLWTSQSDSVMMLNQFRVLSHTHKSNSAFANHGMPAHQSLNDTWSLISGNGSATLASWLVSIVLTKETPAEKLSQLETKWTEVWTYYSWHHHCDMLYTQKCKNKRKNEPHAFEPHPACMHTTLRFSEVSSCTCTCWVWQYIWSCRGI